MNQLRAILRRFLLKGWFFRWWLRWKTGKLVQLYKSLLVRSCDASAPVKVVPPIAAETPLRKLLFITDNMWEQRELVPELARICEVQFVDVHSCIERSRGEHESLAFDKAEAQFASLASTPFDSILVYLRSTLLSKDLLQFLRTAWRCPLLGLNLDCKTTFDDYAVFRLEPTGYKHWAGLFDCNLTNARAMVDVYAQAGANCLYLPTAYHYDPHKHVPPNGPFEFGLSFVGSCKPERQLFIHCLQRMGIELEVFGGGWADSPFVKDGWRIFQKSQLNLGISFNLPDLRMTNLKNRDFECPGVGGCYLTTYDWELADLFQVGKEILCYRGLDDFVELYTYYIRRQDDCRRIGAAGFARCKREHTWEHRFRKVFGQLGFKPAIDYVERN